jgi:cytochrome c peroxidase
MGHPTLDAAVAQIASVEEYQQAFQRVFGRPPNGPDLLRAIASYERTQLSFDSPFDQFIGIIRHNVVALAGQAEKLINSADPAAIDRAAIQHDMSVLGRFLITKQEKDTASFKTPDVRNVLVTAPYFHDGSQERRFGT